MLLPDKHITLAESLLGLGAFVLEHLDRPRTIDALWQEFEKVNNTKEYPAYHSFDNLVLAIDFLFMVQAIKEIEGGELAKCV